MADQTQTIALPARPDPLKLDASQTAVIVIDMQNAYASPGGYVDLAGFDISGAAGVIGRIGETLTAARAAGLPIVFLQNGRDPEYVEAGTPKSPNWHKSNALKTMRNRPELRGKLLGLIQAPATKVAGVVQAPAGQLARVIAAYGVKAAA